MPDRSPTFTNLLLVVVIVLLAANLAVPMLRSDPAAPPPKERVDDGLTDRIEDLEVNIRLARQEMRLAANRPSDAVNPTDDIVVRVPGKLAEELEITAEDVRTVVEGLAHVARRARTSLGAARKGANGVAAIATCRNCSSAQAQFQATAKADVDNDGTGEFGSFVELSGARDVRGDGNVGRLNPPVLSGAFRNPSNGIVTRSGYNYRIFLPDHAGEGVCPDREGFDRVSTEDAEATWCMYAWPVKYGETGTRTFMINQTGDVVATEYNRYSGPNGPLPGAAFLDRGTRSITGYLAIGKAGQDGNIWRQVN